MVFARLILLSEQSTLKKKRPKSKERVIKLTKLQNFKGNAVMVPGREQQHGQEQKPT